MNKQIKKLNFLILLSLLPLTLFAKGFEGSITLVKETCFDTTFFTYYVSDGKIRIEEFNSKKNLQSVFIVNTNNEDVFIINPEKKLYTKLIKKPMGIGEEKQFSINKTSDFKMINGVKCYQWRVKNKEKNTEIAYWVTQNDFTFFEKMVKILNHTDKSWEFFNHIPQTQGYFPMVSVERNLVRDEKMRTSVLQINRKSIDSSIFKIPANYKMFVM
jgi:hypothetical protein